MAAKKTPATGGKGRKPKLTGPPRKPSKYLRVVESGENAPDGDSSEFSLDLGPEIKIEDAGDSLESLNLTSRRREAPRPRRGTKLPTIFPNPGGFKLSWDKFYRYWQQCYNDPELRPRMKIYGYRTHPVMLEGSRNVFIGAPDPGEKEIPNKPLTMDDIARMFGSGDYHLKINDKDANNQPICNCNLLGRGPLVDYDTYPPILDMDGIDPAHPSNATYIKQMKAKKRWGSEEEKEKTMDQVDRLLDRLDKANERALRAQGESKHSNDDSRAAEVVAHGAKRALDLVADAASRSNTGGGSSGGVEVFVGVATALAELLKSTKGESNLESITAIMQRSSEAERTVLTSQIEMMRDELRAVRAEQSQRQQNPATSTTEPDDPFKNLRQLAELKDIFQDTFSQGSFRPSKYSWMEQLLPVAMQALQPLASAATYYFQAQAASARGEQPPPPPQTMAQNPQLQPGQQPQQQGQDQGPTPEQFAQFMAELTPRILKFINDPQRNGADFAEFFLDWQDDATYDALVNAGPTPQDSCEAILMQLRTYEPLWRQLASREQYARQFLLEFITAFDQPDDGSDGTTDGTDTGQVAPNGHAPDHGPGAGTISPESQVTGAPAPGWQPNHESSFAEPPPVPEPAPRRTSGASKKKSAKGVANPKSK